MKIKKLLSLTFITIALITLISFLRGESNMMPPENISLPENIKGWRLDGPPRMIDETNIFEYMNGAGELYLGFHLDHLLVYEYTDKTENTIVVELYQMKNSGDAFGLLSMDWSGEAIELTPSGNLVEAIIPPYRAIYGKGLLRAWSDDLYFRIMAYKESPGVKEIILELGQLITADRENPDPPDFLKVIKPADDSQWELNSKRTAYFYSHLVLNSFFYLSHTNILSLDPSTEALMVTYEKQEERSGKSSVPLLVIKYPDQESASAALHDFFSAYLPDMTMKNLPGEAGRETREFFQIEDGWMGYRLLNSNLALVFACPDQPSALEILEKAELN